MGLQRHVSGSLKQTNKKHKGERKRNLSISGTKKVVAPNRSMSKKERKHLAKQQRLMKNKVISSAQKQTDKPLTCLLLPLCGTVNLSLAQLMLSKGDAKGIIHKIPDILSAKNTYEANYFCAPTIKKSFCFINGRYDDLFGCLDLARLADWIIFVLPGDISRLDLDNFSELLSVLYSQGLPPSVFSVMSNMFDRKQLIALLNSRFPIDDGRLRSLNSVNDAQSLLRFISHSQKKPTLSAANSYLATKSALQVGTAATRLRSGMLVESVSVIPHEDSEDEVYVRVEGLLRGWDLPLFDLARTLTEGTRTGCPHVHLTGWGDFPLRSATWSDYRPDRRPHHPAPALFQWTATEAPDEYLADALTAAWDNLQLQEEEESEYEDLEEEENENDACMSVDGDEGENNDEEEEKNVEVGDMPSDDSEDDSTYYDAMDSEAAVPPRNKAVSFLVEPSVSIPSSSCAKSRSVADKIRAAKEELQFPDEVETPFDVPARERFAKYRGLPSFSKCVWPTENDTSLPFEYSKIFRFGNYMHNRRTLIKHTLRLLRKLAEEGPSATSPTFIPSGSVACLTLGPVPQALGTAMLEAHTGGAEARPLTAWSMLPYERCMSVLHLTMQKRRPHWLPDAEVPMDPGDEDGENRKEEFDPDPVMGKEPMLFQVGIRRFTACPIYSQANKAANTNSKMERFFTMASSPIVATMYAPVVYAPQTALQFRIEPSEEDASKMVVSSLIGIGSVLSVDPTRAIVKRILLSGHPYKINKRTAVVRYMFHSPEDIEYFKPIQMHTKTGAVGHIKQSVGTHGLMKCHFDRQLIASDVVLMPLYKRVFPKMTFDPQVMPKVAAVDLVGRFRSLPTSAAAAAAPMEPAQGILKTKGKETGATAVAAALTEEEEELFS